MKILLMYKCIKFKRGRKETMDKWLIQYKLAREELSKVIFPIKEQIRNALVSVLVVVSTITLFLALLDFSLGAFVSSVL